MKDSTIKQTLEKDLKKITHQGFNQKIISNLNINKKKREILVFDTKHFLAIAIAAFLFYFFNYYDTNAIKNKTVLLLSILFCCIPIFFIVFNKIHQLSINQKTN